MDPKAKYDYERITILIRKETKAELLHKIAERNLKNPNGKLNPTKVIREYLENEYGLKRF